MYQGWSKPSERRMFSRTSKGTAGLAANCARGSPGASERMAKITKLMSSKVGIAMSSLRRRYFPISSLSLWPRHFCSGRRREPKPPPACPDALDLLGPVRDVPHLRVPGVRDEALELLARTGEGRATSHERDDDYIRDEEVVHLDDEVVPLRGIELLLVLGEQVVIGLVAPALGVVAGPFQGGGLDLRAGPARQVVRRVGRFAAVRVHLDIGEELRGGVGALAAREERAPDDGLQLDLDAELRPAVLHDVLFLLAQGVHGRLVDDAHLLAVLGADAVGTLDPAGVILQLV